MTKGLQQPASDPQAAAFVAPVTQEKHSWVEGGLLVATSGLAMPSCDLLHSLGCSFPGSSHPRYLLST